MYYVKEYLGRLEEKFRLDLDCPCDRDTFLLLFFFLDKNNLQSTIFSCRVIVIFL